MCGFAGLLKAVQFGARDELEIIVKHMTDTLVHRGPDDGGYWCDGEHGVAFGHRRLSVLDLSAAGHQPMLSPSQRYVLIFNGEIYNHLLMREEMEPRTGAFGWRGGSDTETILAGFDIWG